MHELSWPQYSTIEDQGRDLSCPYAFAFDAVSLLDGIASFWPSLRSVPLSRRPMLSWWKMMTSPGTTIMKTNWARLTFAKKVGSNWPTMKKIMPHTMAVAQPVMEPRET